MSLRHLRRSAGLVSALALAVSATLVRGSEAPVFEAEAGNLPGGARIEADADASGEAFVAQDGDYRPLLEVPLPAEGDAFVVWGRARGHGICLKSRSTDGKQSELKWLFGWPSDEWTWRRFGTWTREELGEAAVFIRQPNADPGAGLDAVAISADLDFLPPGAERPATPAQKPKPPVSADAPTAETAALAGDAAAPIDETPVAATASVDWSKVIHPVPQGVFSVAIFAGFDPEVAATPAYQEGLAYLNLPIVRYHNANLVDDSTEKGVAWVDVENKRWDAEKIVAALTAWNPPDVQKVITIPSWPVWMDQDGDKFLDTDQIEAFANFCADLVRITNVNNDFKIPFFEITNERDGLYWVNLQKKGQPERLAELTQIYNAAARAMKAVDPSIQTGGPAAMRPDYVEELRRFATATLPNLDFLSVHGYASGSTEESDASIYNKTRNLGDHIKALRTMLTEISPDRRIPIHLNEYNISWTWETREPRMVDHKGAVFDALCFVEFATNGLDVSNAWNERDGVYGKMSKEYELRPAAHVFHYVNSWMKGDAVAVESSDPEKVVVFAAMKNGDAGLLVINRTNVENSLQFPTSASDSPWEMARISEAGLEKSTLDSLSEKMVLPPHSVTFLHGAVPEVPQPEATPTAAE